MQKIDEHIFQEISNNNKHKIFIVCADWNGACQIMAPIIKEAEKLYSNEIDFFEIDFDTCDSIKNTYKVVKVPTFLFFNSNTLEHKHSGLLSKKEMRDIIEKLIND